jgi:F-box-like
LYRAGPGQGLQRVTIGSLPDDVLLVIFVFLQAIVDEKKRFSWDWIKLVHVCQRWRYIIFESPIRLDLQLICTVRSPVRTSLDVWPPFPLAVLFCGWDSFIEDQMDNTVAALEQRDRVREIYITSLDNLWKRIVTVMQKPFPALRSLTLESSSRPFGRLRNTFLNGSAPSLQNLVLHGISFPWLPQLLSSTSDLTSLHLFNIPSHLNYSGPEEMAASLSALPKLKSLIINFEPSVFLYDKDIDRVQSSPLPTRFVLPALTHVEFEGVSEYLEILAARIDAPVLDDFQITFFHWAQFGFDTKFLSDIPQAIRFFGLLDSFGPSGLTLDFNNSRASLSFPSNTTCHPEIPPSLCINCKRLDWQVISVARICSQILLFCSRIKSLNIKYDRPVPVRGHAGLRFQQDEPGIDSMLWSQLFLSFPSVQRLEIDAMLESSMAPALQSHSGESAAGVALPSLHSLSIVGNENETAQEGIAAGLWEQQTSSRFLISRSL